MVVVNYGNVDVFYFKVGSQWHYQQLNDWHGNNHSQNHGVAKYLAKLFLE
jgi:hypothetical protein